jgi:hypothetical protein
MSELSIFLSIHLTKLPPLAANVILSRVVKPSALKSWALGVAKRAGPKKAKVALARKLAVILHRMLADGTAFNSAKSARPMIAA